MRVLTYEQWHHDLATELQVLYDSSWKDCDAATLHVILERVAQIESQLKMPKLFYTLYCYYEQAREGRHR